MARKKQDPALALEPEPQEQRTEIGPGDLVDVRFGRLENGEWYASLGAPDSDGLCATSSFPWEALRGLQKLVKQAGDLGAYRVAGEQEMGRCEQVSSDGADCCVLGCRIINVPAVVGALKLAANAAPEFGDDEVGRFAREHGEIVRLYGVLKEPGIKAKGTDQDVLTATFEAVGDDMTPEYRYLRPSSKQEVVAIIYHANRVSLAASTRERLDQPDLFTGEEAPPAAVEVLACPSCLRIIRTEGQMPGAKCPECEFGTLEIREVRDLRCSHCGYPQETTDQQEGDNCTQCGVGQYAIPITGGSTMGCCEKERTEEGLAEGVPVAPGTAVGDNEQSAEGAGTAEKSEGPVALEGGEGEAEEGDNQHGA